MIYDCIMKFVVEWYIVWIIMSHYDVIIGENSKLPKFKNVKITCKIYGDQEMHDVVRTRCCDYMELNQDYFQHFITENFQHYIRRKRQPHTHGNHVEIQAMSEQYCRLFEIYEYRNWLNF